MEMWLIYFFNQLKPEVAELYVGYDHHRDIIRYICLSGILGWCTAPSGG